MNRRKKGAAMALVLMVASVLIILCAILLDVSLADTRNAVNQEKKIQAHYLARSGVYVAIDMISKKLTAETFVNIKTLADDLNIKNSGDFPMDGIGSFNLNYGVSESNELKIISIGKVNGDREVTDRVTLLLDLVPGMMSDTIFKDNVNPAGWTTGSNLDHDVDGTVLGGSKKDNFLGQGVRLEGGGTNPIKVPKGGQGKSSVFKAAVVFFKSTSYKISSTETADISLLQQPQAAGVTFDAQILFFEGGIITNTTGTGGGCDPINFTVSSDVLGKWIESPLNWPPNTVTTTGGFEIEGNYDKFINTYREDLYSQYHFDMSGDYGVVYLGGKVQSDDGRIIINPDDYKEPFYEKGWFYFKSGTSFTNLLKDPSKKSAYLIPILKDDGVVKAIKALLGYKINIDDNQKHMWDPK